MAPGRLAARLWHQVESLSVSAPIIHNFTNLVVQNETAAAIAATGGVQATLHTREEARGAAGAAAALAVNIGTLDEAWLEAVKGALEVATDKGVPWVLDPVAAGFTRYRTDATHELLRLRPAILKGNASEIMATAGLAGAGRAADSVHGVDEAVQAARQLAQAHGCIVVVSGSEDLITDGEREVRIANGHPMMGRMIGSGCMLTSVIACFLAVAVDPFEAAEAAVTYFTVAGEIAAEQAKGPGTLKPLLIDALYSLDKEQFRRRIRMRAILAGAHTIGV